VSLVLAACGSGSGSHAPDGASGSAGAEVRFSYQADWANHLGCASISSYQIQFGAIPTPVSFNIDTTTGAPGSYKTVDGRTYRDADVLHIYTCSDGTDHQNYGRFGIDLPFASSKRYTVTLAGAAATYVEDP